MQDKIDRTMTIEEAIQHAEKVAQEHTLCGKEHRQLAEWLKELKELKAKDGAQNNGKLESNVDL